MGHGPQLCAGGRLCPDHHPEPARPAAAARLKELGADIVTVDLTSDAGHAEMEELLAAAAAVGLSTRHGLLEPGAILRSATSYYGVYPAAKGYIAVGALGAGVAGMGRGTRDPAGGRGVRLSHWTRDLVRGDQPESRDRPDTTRTAATGNSSHGATRILRLGNSSKRRRVER